MQIKLKNRLTREFFFLFLFLGKPLLFLLSFLLLLFHSLLLVVLDRLLELSLAKDDCVKDKGNVGKHEQENSNDQSNACNDLDVQLRGSI